MPKIEGQLSHLLRRIKDRPNPKMMEIIKTSDSDYQYGIREELKTKMFFLDFTNILTETGVVTEQSFLREFFFRVNRRFFHPFTGTRNSGPTCRKWTSPQISPEWF